MDITHETVPAKIPQFGSVETVTLSRAADVQKDLQKAVREILTGLLAGLKSAMDRALDSKIGSRLRQHTGAMMSTLSKGATMFNELATQAEKHENWLANPQNRDSAIGKALHDGNFLIPGQWTRLTHNHVQSNNTRSHF